MFDSAMCCNVTDMKGFVGFAGQFGSAMFIPISNDIIITMAAISIVLYLTYKGGHTALYKINQNVYFIYLFIM